MKNSSDESLVRRLLELRNDKALLDKEHDSIRQELIIRLGKDFDGDLGGVYVRIEDKIRTTINPTSAKEILPKKIYDSLTTTTRYVMVTTRLLD